MRRDEFSQNASLFYLVVVFPKCRSQPDSSLVVGIKRAMVLVVGELCAPKPAGNKIDSCIPSSAGKRVGCGQGPFSALVRDIQIPFRVAGNRRASIDTILLKGDVMWTEITFFKDKYFDREPVCHVLSEPMIFALVTKQDN